MAVKKTLKKTATVAPSQEVKKAEIKKKSILPSFGIKKQSTQKEEKQVAKKEEPKSTNLGKIEEKKADVVAPKKTTQVESGAPSAPVTATPRIVKITEKKLGFFDTFGLGKDRDHFIENLSMLVLSGMPITGALAAITRDTKNPKMKSILETILAELEAGSPLWKAFDRTGLFKGYTISLIRIGEESGKFAENLKVVSQEQEKERGLKSKVRSALMYPAFVLFLTAFIGIAISWAILPKLAKIFADLKLDLPLITKILIGFGLFLSKYGLVVVPLGIIVLGFIIFFVFVNEKTKFLGEYIIYAVPGVNTLMMEVEVARFGYLLGTLLDAGLPITKAIDSLIGASDSIRYKAFYTYLHDSVDMGNSFQKSFAGYKNINNKNNIKLCLDCLNGELDKYGEMYLHRIHQIPFSPTACPALFSN